MKILLIEDDVLIRNCFQMYLERKGHEVAIYNRGEGAIEYAMEMRPDLVLTDHNLGPGDIKGVEIAYFLTQKGQRAILMSGDPDIAHSAEAADVPFVEKTTVKDVLRMVEEVASHAG